MSTGRALIVEYQDVARGLLQQKMNQANLASLVDFATNPAEAFHRFGDREYAIVVLGYGTARLELIKPQTAALEVHFPRARRLLHGPYDLGFDRLGADGFISSRDANGLLVATIRQAIGS